MGSALRSGAPWPCLAACRWAAVERIVCDPKDAGRSQRKLWWKSVSVLTCKSIDRLGYRGERLIEPSSSWFPPKFPPGYGAWLYPVKRMIRGLGGETISTYSQTFNGYDVSVSLLNC
uniref:Secreted protein n=1 Tax=Heterorhabditis bacteriophora TaxID=37862 RepID=A0A1I7WDE5_HETBA